MIKRAHIRISAGGGNYYISLRAGLRGTGRRLADDLTVEIGRVATCTAKLVAFAFSIGYDASPDNWLRDAVLISPDGLVGPAPAPADLRRGYPLQELRGITGHHTIELVRSRLDGKYVLVVDEDGWLKPGALLNPTAANLAGRGITGAVLYCRRSYIK